MSKLEREDPEFMAAMQAYQQQLGMREVLSIDHLLLRLNSVTHVKHSLEGLVDKARVEYQKVLETYRMDVEVEMARLEGVLERAGHVRLAKAQALRLLQHIEALHSVLQIMEDSTRLH
jgi:hypothetical protein